MREIAWDPAMNTGVKEIDDQHIYVTGVIAELFKAYMDGRDKDVLIDVIRQINEYARFHFETEERYMQRIVEAYPRIEFHKEKHVEFFTKVIDFMLSTIEGDEELAPKVLDYLVDWWFSHIRGVDKEMCMYLTKAGIA